MSGNSSQESSGPSHDEQPTSQQTHGDLSQSSSDPNKEYNSGNAGK